MNVEEVEPGEPNPVSKTEMQLLQKLVEAQLLSFAVVMGRRTVIVESGIAPAPGDNALLSLTAILLKDKDPATEEELLEGLADIASDLFADLKRALDEMGAEVRENMKN